MVLVDAVVAVLLGCCAAVLRRCGAAVLLCCCAALVLMVNLDSPKSWRLVVLLSQRVEVTLRWWLAVGKLGRVKVRLSLGVGEIKWCAFHSSFVKSRN